MPNFEIITFESDELLARSVAEKWANQLQQTLRANVRYSVAFSGGRIARRFFSVAAELIKSRGIDLRRIDYFWGDERCVPPTDPESNFAMARELFLLPLNATDAQIHRVRGEDPPDQAAQAAARELCEIISPGTNGQPTIDLIFLGMGEDGHVASLFPAEPESIRGSSDVFRAVTATKPPPRRITIGYGVIAAAKEVWVMASGGGKEKALRDSIAPGGETPLARLLKLRAQTKIFTDIKLKQ
jgi:6-phosphogluconolactonase